MKHWILIGSGLVALLAVASVVWLLSSLDSLAKRAIETYGSEVTQTSVNVDAVRISLVDGVGSIHGLVIGNPHGFNADYIFRLGEIDFDLDTSTVTEDVVVVKEIRILTPLVIYEIGVRGSNINALEENIAAYGGGGDVDARDDDVDTSDGPKLVIDHLYVTGGTVSASALGTGGRTVTTPLPDLHLENIGRSSGGATGTQVAQQLLKALAKGSLRAVAKLNLDTLKGVGGTGVEALKGGGKQLGEGVDNAAEGLKKLFD